jgi:hypothetical protein
MKVAYWLTGAAVTLVAACFGEGNTGQVTIPSYLVADVPWMNGSVALREPDGGLIAPADLVFPPIATGMPDPGWGPMDCSPLTGIVPSQAAMVTFERDPSSPNSIGVGPAFSSYDDGTFGSFRVPGDASWYSGLIDRYPAAFGLAAEQIPGLPTCDGTPNKWAMHIRGGRFNWYGAGLEHPLGALVPECPPGSDFCPPDAGADASVDSAGFPLTPQGGGVYAAPAAHTFWDLSNYDGVVFWARSGPEATPGFLVALQDKFTSDALNRQNNKYCTRIKQCFPECLNGAPCTSDGLLVPTFRCFNPDAGMALVDQPAELEEVYPRCGQSACTSANYYPDPDFDPTTCKPYEFSGKQAAYFCYGDTPPPSESERCDDGFVMSISLSTEWQIYVLPFNQFQQVGFGKPAPYFDLRSVYEVAFEFPVGYVDAYIDNVTFYKNPPNQ